MHELIGVFHNVHLFSFIRIGCVFIEIDNTPNISFVFIFLFFASLSLSLSIYLEILGLRLRKIAIIENENEMFGMGHDEFHF